MRKSQREIKDFNEIIRLLDKCQTIRLGLLDKDYPYVVPLSFGYEVKDGNLFIYFHCAKEGKKINLLSESNKVCVESDILNGYKKTEHGVTADYESFIAFGKAQEVFDGEAKHGLELLLAHCGIDGYSPEKCWLTKMVAVYKISINEITAKKKIFIIVFTTTPLHKRTYLRPFYVVANQYKYVRIPYLSKSCAIYVTAY